MNKKALWMVVLLAMIGAGTVFGQQGGQGRQSAVAGVRHIGLSQADYIQIVEVRGSVAGDNRVISVFGDSFPDNLSPPDKPGYNDGGYRWAYEQLMAAKVKEKKVAKAPQYLVQPDGGAQHCMVKTGVSQTITIITYDDPRWYSPSAKNKMFIIQPNSLFAIKKNPKGKADLVLYSGAVIQDFDYRNAAKLEEVMSFYASAGEEYDRPIRAHVDSIKSRYTKNGVLDKDALAKEVVNVYAVGGGAVGAVWAIGGNLLIPAEFVHTMWQYCNQAAMAYALAYVYGDTSNFQNDLYFLFAGKAGAKETIESIGLGQLITGGKAVTKAVVTSSKVKGAMGKAMPQLTTKVTNILTKGAAIEFKGVPVIGKALDGVIGGVLSGSAAKSFGTWAIEYYKG